MRYESDDRPKLNGARMRRGQGYFYTRVLGAGGGALLLSGALMVGTGASFAGVHGERYNQAYVYVYPSPPSNLAAPGISGSASDGQTLTGSHGTWSNSPSSYVDEWEDCDAAGQHCAPNGATGLSYALTGSDIGHTIRLLETAANSAGTSAPALSAPTAVVQAAASGSGAPPAPPKVTIHAIHVSGTTVTVNVACTASAGQTCALSLFLSVVEKLNGGHVIALTPSIAHVAKTKRKQVVIGRATASIAAGQSTTVRIALNGKGKRLLDARHRLAVTLRITLTTTTIATRTVVFKTTTHRHRH